VNLATLVLISVGVARPALSEMFIDVEEEMVWFLLWNW